MEKTKSPLIILNLAGELSIELMNYILSRNIKVIESEEKLIEENWSHILTKDVSDFGVINVSYDVVEKDRSIISLSAVKDLQNFTKNNGNLILDNSWFKDSEGIGPFIMDKYFQGYGGLTLGDNYPVFKEDGSFKVVNPFNTGEYLDRMIHNAFESGADALTIKTFFDHLLMYLAGLKKKGKAGLPFEVMYGKFADIYAIQINFFSQHLQILDVATSLSPEITKKAEEYFLNTAVQSTDFFDFSYLPEVKKVTITAFWTKDERIKFENRGLMFMSLSSGASVTLVSNKVENEAEAEFSQVVKAPELEDFSDKIVIPSSLPDEIFSTVVNSERAITDDEMQIIRGDFEKLDTIVKKVKGKFEEEKSSFLVPGGKLDVDDISFKIAASVNDSTSESRLNVRSLEGKLPEKIKLGIFDFAKTLNKEALDLSEDDLINFQLDKMPEIIQQAVKEQIVVEQYSELKELAFKTEDEGSLLKGGTSLNELIQTIKDNFEEVQDTIIVPGQKLDVEQVSLLIASNIDKSVGENNLQVRTLGHHLPSKIQTGLFDFAKGINKTVDDLNLADLTTFQSNDVPQIIQQEISSQIMMAKSALEFNNKKEHDNSGEEVKALRGQLQELKSNNEKLKSQIATLNSEKSRITELMVRTSEIDSQVEASNPLDLKVERDQSDDKLMIEFETKFKSQSAITIEDMSKITALIESKSRLMETLKIEENKMRKLQLSSVQKENFLKQEISKSEKQIKSKNLMLVKTKETFTRLIEKKESETQDLKSKLDQLTKLQASGPNLSQSKELVELEKKNQQLIKQLESYQSKISVLQQNLLVAKQSDDSKDEVRKLQSVNQQVRSQNDLARKQIEKMMEKQALNLELIASLKSEKSNLEQLLNKAATQKDRERETNNQSSASDLEVKRLKSQNQLIEAQLKDANAKIAHVESKLVETLRSQRSAPVQEDASKMKAHMDVSIKKLGQDLAESKNQLIELKKETNKLRQDKISLQNQLDKVRKDAEKAKSTGPGTPKKTSGKAA